MDGNATRGRTVSRLKTAHPLTILSKQTLHHWTVDRPGVKDAYDGTAGMAKEVPRGGYPGTVFARLSYSRLWAGVGKALSAGKRRDPNRQKRAEIRICPAKDVYRWPG